MKARYRITKKVRSNRYFSRRKTLLLSASSYNYTVTLFVHRLNIRGFSTISRHNRNNDGDSYRTNHQINASEVRVIDSDGEQVDIMPPDEGLEMAEDQGLDLVEVAPDADPPVCRIMDYGKFKYQQSKKKQAKSDNVSLKTLRFRPKTQEHDLQTKLDRAVGFIEKGNQVQFEMQMRGRERQFEDRWVEKLEGIIEKLQENLDRDINIVNEPTAEGWNIRAIVEPN